MTFVKRPNAQEWTQQFEFWPKIPNFVGVIDDTSHEIIPHDEQQL